MEVAGGEELRGLACLLPRKKKGGKLYVGKKGYPRLSPRSVRSYIRTSTAPKRVSQHIVISARPTPPERQSTVHKNPPRPSYPKDVLKHSFVPYGARSEQTRSEDVSIDVDNIETTRDKPAEAPKEKPAKTKESKGKKRKVDGDSPKKSKKHKTNA